jgi:CheY-like chemotaxis protein
MTATPLAGRKILVVEDDDMIAQVIVDLLEDAGATIIGPVGTLEQAMVAATDTSLACDSAILDINLHGIASYSVADALTARHVRVVFATGYGKQGIDAAYQHYPHCTKPFTWQALLSALG